MKTEQIISTINEGKRLLTDNPKFDLRGAEVIFFLNGVINEHDPFEAICQVYEYGIAKGSRLQKKKGVSAATPTPKSTNRK